MSATLGQDGCLLVPFFIHTGMRLGKMIQAPFCFVGKIVHPLLCAYVFV